MENFLIGRRLVGISRGCLGSLVASHYRNGEKDKRKKEREAEALASIQGLHHSTLVGRNLGSDWIYRKGENQAT